MHNEVALGSLQRSRGEDAQAECPRKTLRVTRSHSRKRLRLTQSRPPLEMGFDRARGFAPHPGDAGGDGAIPQSSVDAADVDRTGRRDVLESAKVSAPLSRDRSAAADP
jgi:hypothetical protein